MPKTVVLRGADIALVGPYMCELNKLYIDHDLYRVTKLAKSDWPKQSEINTTN